MIYEFNHLFEVETLQPAENRLHIFRYSLSAKHKIRQSEAAGGSGIYGILRKEEAKSRLIYIGMHNTRAPFHKDRIEKHIQTFIPGFSHAMSLGERSHLAENEEDLQKLYVKKYGFPGCNENELFNIFKDNLLQVPHRSSKRPPANSFLGAEMATVDQKGSGIETSKRRFQFSCHFWAEVQNQNNPEQMCSYLNKHYEFFWFPIRLNGALVEKIPTGDLKKFETSLIYKHRPVLNTFSGNEEVSAALNNNGLIFTENGVDNLCNEIEADVAAFGTNLNQGES